MHLSYVLGIIIANVKCSKIDLSKMGISSSCDVYYLDVEIDDVASKVKEMITLVSNTSWINKLSVVAQASYSARSERTITKILQEILAKVDISNITADFGEFMVSSTAQEVLVKHYKHTSLPLAELLKEKNSGNPGFDFHTESNTSLIIFGEAKYSASNNTHTIAMRQITQFIDLKKDIAEFVDLEHFISPKAITSAIANTKGFAAAFSIGDENKYDLKKVISSKHFTTLLSNSELYLIGIKIK